MNSIRLASYDCLFNRRPSVRIDRIIIHTMEGSFGGTIAWFQTSGRKPPTAAHYLFSKTGDVCQMVPDFKKCLHANSYNSRSIGFEHEGRAADTQFSEAMLVASARCCAVLCRKYAIPIDREHIIGHNEVPDATHTDPGAHWPWAHYMSLVLAAAG
jgi:N-acetyl-anhydromuramyl-L-alanine amidase AmpD